MVLSFVRAQPCRLAQLALRHWANLCLAVNRSFPATMCWLSTHMTMWTLYLLHSTTFRSSHRGFCLCTQLLVSSRLFTYDTLIMVCIILDWGILLIWILSSTVWLKYCWSTWPLLFRSGILLWTGNWLVSSLNHWWIFLENLFKI